MHSSKFLHTTKWGPAKCFQSSPALAYNGPAWEHAFHPAAKRILPIMKKNMVMKNMLIS